MTELTVRQRQILGILNSRRSFMRGREIADFLGVTDRTVRSEMQGLAEFLEEKGIRLEARRGIGYCIRCDHPELLQQVVYRQSVAMGQEDRILEIVKTLLDASEPIPAGDFEDEFYISRATLDNDLKTIAFRYEREQPHLRLLRKKNTIAFEADEWKKRYVMNLLYTSRWNYNYEGGMQMEDLPLPDREMRLVERSVREVLHSNRILMTEYDHICFTFSVAIAVRRIRQGFLLKSASGGKSGTADKRDPSEPLVREILDKIRQNTELSFPDNELLAIADELTHRIRYRDEQPEEGSRKGGRKSSASLLVGKALSCLDGMWELGFSKEQGLKNELVSVLEGQMHNPWHTGIRDGHVIRRIRSENPDAVELACLFQEAGGLSLTENFLYEVAASFAEFLQDLPGRTGQKGIRTGIVSHMTSGASRFMMVQLKAFFGERISLEGPVPVYAFMEDRERDWEICVTTTRVAETKTAYPVLNIPLLPEKHHYEQLNFLATLALYRRLYPGNSVFAGDTVTHWQMLFPETGRSRRILLKELCLRAESCGIAGPESVLEVDRREQMSSTAFREGFALPHQMTPVAHENALIGVRLPSAMDWGGVQVEYVFLLLLKPGNDWLRIYTMMTFILRRLKSQKLLDNITGGEELRKLFEEIERAIS